MSATAFLIDALTSALELGIGTPADVLGHVTPELLAAHLPRPLWARLFTACLGAPRVDAQLVLETVGVANLCAHLPASVMWRCVAELGARALGGALPVAPARPITSAPIAASPAAAPVASPVAAPAPPPAAEPLSIGSPPPPAPPPPAPEPMPPALAATVPLPGLAELGADLERASNQPTRARTPTSQRFRQAGTGLGRLGAGQRRPQAQAAAPEVATTDTGVVAEIARHVRRGETEVEVVAAPDVRPPDEWRNQLVVDDELVDWPSQESTATADVDDSKR